VCVFTSPSKPRKCRSGGRKEPVSTARPATRADAQCGQERPPTGWPAWKGANVADLLYAVLLIAVFAVLALVLRGLEKL
jgi:hypothetical protein